MAIHCRLSTLLGERRIKMAELSRMTGVSKTTINAMYHDRVRKIDYGVLERICKALFCRKPRSKLFASPISSRAI